MICSETMLTALGMLNQLLGWFTTEKSQQLLNGLLTFCIDVYCAQRMNPCNFDDLLTFSVKPTAGQIFHLS